MIERVHPRVLGSLRQAAGALSESDSSFDSYLETRNPHDLFRMYCEWEGLSTTMANELIFAQTAITNYIRVSDTVNSDTRN